MAIDKKDKKFIQYWENIMQLGRLPYSLIYVFIICFFLFVLNYFAYYLFTDESLLHLNWYSFLSAFVCYLIGIFIFYVPAWNVNSFKYHVILKKKTKGKSKKK